MSTKTPITTTNRNPKEQRASDSLIIATVLLGIVSAFYTVQIIVGWSSLGLFYYFPLNIIVIIAFLVCFIQMIKRGVRVEMRFGNWERLYYSPMTYILITLIAMCSVPYLFNHLAVWQREASGLPPYVDRGFASLGIGMIAIALTGVNIAYITIALIVSLVKKRKILWHTLFNVAIALMIASVLWVSWLGYKLIVDAPPESYPEWNF